MNLLCTHPGRHGDLLWVLPSIRALHEAGHTVGLALSEKYSSLAPLIRQQVYVQYVQVVPESDWSLVESAPITPRAPTRVMGEVNGDLCDITDPVVGAVDAVVHLGYDGWPQAPLPYHVYNTLKREHPQLPIAPLSLGDPWIRARAYDFPARLVVGFSDEWFELKYGLCRLLEDGNLEPYPVYPLDSRWHRETHWLSTDAMDWQESARMIAGCHLFLGCCSALYVLACALGKPCIIAEPAEARHNPVFWPLGKDGPRVLAPKGIDGRQTWDARHVRDAIDHFFQTGRLV